MAIPSTVNPAYEYARSDLLSLLPQREFRAVLDIGCSTGATAKVLKDRAPNVTVVGIEHDGEAAQRARAVLDTVLVGDADERLAELATAGATFDLVLCGDVLEHLVDPWATLRRIRALCPAGNVLVSLPNVAHVSTLVSLLGSYWPYRDRGIFDRTHLRFFGRRNLPELFGPAGFRLVEVRTRHRVFERPHPWNQKLEPLVSRLPLLSRLTEYQFLCLLEPSSESSGQR